MNFMRDAGSVSCRRDEHAGCVIQLGQVRKMSSNSHARSRELFHAFGLIDTGNGERHIWTKFRPDLRKDLFEKPNQGVAIRAAFFVYRADEKESRSLIEAARRWCWNQ